MNIAILILVARARMHTKALYKRASTHIQTYIRVFVTSIHNTMSKFYTSIKICIIKYIFLNSSQWSCKYVLTPRKSTTFNFFINPSDQPLIDLGIESVF